MLEHRGKDDPLVLEPSVRTQRTTILSIRTPGTTILSVRTPGTTILSVRTPGTTILSWYRVLGLAVDVITRCAYAQGRVKRLSPSLCVCGCVSSKNTAVCCLTARKSPRNSSLPLGLAIYILRKMPRKPDESSVEQWRSQDLLSSGAQNGRACANAKIFKTTPISGQNFRILRLHENAAVRSVSLSISQRSVCKRKSSCYNHY